MVHEISFKKRRRLFKSRRQVLSSTGDLLLKHFAELQRMGDAIKDFLGAAAPNNHDRTVSQQPAKNALVRLHGFHFLKIHFHRASGDQPDFDDDPFVGDGEFAGEEIQQRTDSQRKNGPPGNEDDPMVLGFVDKGFVFDQIVLHVLAHGKPPQKNSLRG
ncbi:MAG: hypothetical protein A2931_00015 [Candidatus Niyogibacteria bacterium RIFCSPLOWO2_01_FULL_45_48]|uniref:Uncharacterized protein n=1 Tax=Candidatus Niyogibacteria bacterium RIFCSPLOWO2_01_FULL_45_48 TaxID=1801724 RepID=A0A1G2EW21_9BACT|nr:MAG: hypothetical protein A2931_00015 [Candidatus Niyogibacteria bacterium RIFCSPLOWO2_01_FULL_45_48]